MPDFTTLIVESDGPRGSITLNRPEKLNALSGELLEELAAAARWFDSQPDVKVVVIAGNGRAFSAGADVTGFADPDDGPIHRRSDRGRQMADALEDMRAVTIAKIHGHCVGGALVLAAACDLRVAAEDTRFSIPEVDLGIPLAWGGIPRLVREIGPAATKELVMTCRPFYAPEARALGFLNRVVPADQLDGEVDALVASLVEMPTLPLEATKRHVNAVTAAMVGTDRAWSDAHALIAARNDPESQAAAERYIARFRK
jgi:enoyl-CoA hydratase/carnithine racemase